MEQRPLNPRGASVAIDANALKRVDAARSDMVDRLLALEAAGEFRLIVPHGIRGELQRPNTPPEERGPGLAAIFTIQTGLVSHEQQQLRALKEAMRGSALPGKHEADAEHLFDASKNCSYFITHDETILRRAGDLDKIIPPSLTIVRLDRFLEIYDEWPKARTGSGSRHSPHKKRSRQRRGPSRPSAKSVPR